MQTLARLTLASLMVVVAATGVGTFDKRPPVRVYVFTAQPPDAVVSEEGQGREDSVRDLREALARRSGFVLAATPDDAQLRVEVVNREQRDAGAGGFGGPSLTPFRETIVRLRIETAGQDNNDNDADRAELKGIGRPSWKDAAKDAAERLAKWVQSHPPPAAKLPARPESS